MSAVIQIFYPSTKPLTTAPQTLSPAIASARRAVCYIGNTHATNAVYVSLGATATAGVGLYVAPKSTETVTGWNGSISAIASGAGTVVSVMEGFLDETVTELE